MKDPGFKVIQLRKGTPVDLRHFGSPAIEIVPIELYLLPEGTLNDTPTFALVMIDGVGRPFVAQLSKKMLDDAMAAKEERLDDLQN